MKSISVIAGSIFLFGLSLVLILLSYLIFSREIGIWNTETGIGYEVPQYFGYLVAIPSGIVFFFAIRLLRKAFIAKFK